MLVGVVVSTVVAASLLQSGHAQVQSISTSADDHGGIFFGEGVVQVIITDPDANDDSTIEDLTVNIEADPDSGSQGSLAITVPETSDSSERFEFYLVHVSASAVDPSDIDAINSRGVEGDGSCVLACAPFVTFGTSGDLEVDADLYEDVTFDINTGIAETRISYEQDLAQVELDRRSYGSDSFVYVTIIDQDANLNPSAADEFVVDPDSLPNRDLLELGGGSIAGIVTFRETSDNSARFEGRYELGATMTFESEALVLTLFDKANYNATLAAGENESDSTDEVSFTIGDSDGTIDVGGSEPTWDPKISSDKTLYALGENVTITIADPDANASPSVIEVLDIELSTSNGSAVVEAEEFGQNSGVFQATFQLGSDGAIAGTELHVVAGEPIEITYVDEKPADYAARIQNGQDPEKEFTLEVKTVEGVAGRDSTSLSSPEVRGAGESAGPHQVGSQLALATTIENNRASSQPFVILIEVRDNQGVTAYLALQSGILSPNGSSTVESSWQPELGGEYEVRTFAVSSLQEGIVISEVSSSTTTVV